MLTRDFYLRDSRTVAEELLGKLLVHQTEEGVTSGMIVETEAYPGPEDKGAHSYGGRRTERTEAMFGQGGHAYIYLIYGMYDCFNVVANRADKPEAVLIRALEPVEGTDLMERRLEIKNRRRTKLRPGAPAEGRLSLCSGPGKLCVAMGITKKNYGQDLCGQPLAAALRAGSPADADRDRSLPREDLEGGGDRLFIQDYQVVARSGIRVSPRINIEYAEEYRDVPWRYYIGDNPCVSKVAKRYRDASAPFWAAVPRGGTAEERGEQPKTAEGG